MERLWRWIRGALGLGLAWGLAWFTAGLVVLLVVGPDAADVPFPLAFGLLGFLAGLTFSGILSLTEGRRRFEEMSLPRFAGWGALGGALFSAVFVPVAGLGVDAFLGLGGIFALAGGGCAAASLALARTAEGSGAVEAGREDEVEGVGLTEGERRELLG